jgi:hypothetical protein
MDMKQKKGSLSAIYTVNHSSMHRIDFLCGINLDLNKHGFTVLSEGHIGQG